MREIVFDKKITKPSKIRFLINNGEIHGVGIGFDLTKNTCKSL